MMIRSLWLGGICLAAVAGFGTSALAAMDPATARAAVGRTLDADYPRLDALYKDIHAHPELG